MRKQRIIAGVNFMAIGILLVMPHLMGFLVEVAPNAITHLMYGFTKGLSYVAGFGSCVLGLSLILGNIFKPKRVLIFTFGTNFAPIANIYANYLINNGYIVTISTSIDPRSFANPDFLLILGIDYSQRDAFNELPIKPPGLWIAVNSGVKSPEHVERVPANYPYEEIVKRIKASI